MTKICLRASCSLAVAATLALSASVQAGDSLVAKHVGIDDGDNAYIYCSPETITSATPNSVTTRFRRFKSDGSITNGVVSETASNRPVLRCYPTAARTGTPQVVTGSSWSGSNDRATVTCPSSKPFGAYAECQVRDSGSSFVYRGSACGDGIASLGTPILQGQFTGRSGTEPIVKDLGVPTTTFWNDTIAQGDVAGTDMGIPFFSNKRMYYAFGDTWGVAGNLRNGTLASTSLVDPVDVPWLNKTGIVLESWLGTSSSDHNADRIVPVLADEDDCGSTGALPQAGFSITENGHNYKYLWMMSIKTWGYNPQTDNYCEPDITQPHLTRVNRGTIAVSMDDGPWHRLDSTVSWSGTGHFASGHAYHQILGTGGGYVYFMGYRYDSFTNGVSDIGVKAMRVLARHTSITSKAQYEYWYGDAWHKDADCGSSGCAEARAEYVLGPTGPVRDFTVTFNSYVNRYVMMGLWIGTDAWDQPIWEAESLTGPWNYVGSLPMHGYNPYLHERLTLNLGASMIYPVSQWLMSGPPFYNTGIYKLDLTRNTLPSCK
jgi:hypothetical protein